MRLGQAIRATLRGYSPVSMEPLQADLTSLIIEAACKKIEYKNKRVRKLPIEVLIWLLIGMALFRNRSIEAVAAHLNIGWGNEPPTSGGISSKRQAVGPSPIQAVFEYSAQEWTIPSAGRHLWRGLALYGVDGCCLRVADSEKNEAYFGRPPSPKDKNQSGYPQTRIAGLMALRSHLLLGLQFGPYRESETTLAKALWSLLTDNSLVILDKGFIDFALFFHLVSSGVNRHFMARAKKNLRYKVVRELGPGDALVQITLSPKSRKLDPSLPSTLVVRRVQYQRKGFAVEAVLTSLLDPVAYPAKEVGDLYHERWEQELGWDEIKTHTLDQEESLRSMSPAMVEQELWGLGLAYNLVRKQMERFADEQGIEPNQVSYRNALLIIQNTCLKATMGGAGLEKLIAEMNENLRLLILPPRRRERRYPRHVKLKVKKYKRNPGRSGKKPLN